MNIIIEHYTDESIPFLTRSAMALYVGQHSNVRYRVQPWQQIIPGNQQAYTLVYQDGQKSSSRIILGTLKDTISDVRTNATQLGAIRINIDINIPGSDNPSTPITATTSSGNNLMLVAGAALIIYAITQFSK